MLTYLFIGLGIFAVLVVVLLVVVALQPAAFRIFRSTTISAPPEAIFPHVNNLRAWKAWSPFEKLDPAMQQTYGGPPAGVGAIQSWSGNSKAGEGRLTIMESKPNDLVRLKLEFVRPFACCNNVDFTFKPEGSQTVVTWDMTGENGFMAKGFGLIMNMDKMVGKDFAEGLANLKSVVEANKNQ
jgi:hypothetical protein